MHQDLTFFGLTPEYRLALFTQIHEIVFNGNGGYPWETVYNMPIWLRRFTFEKLREHYEKQKEATEQQNKLVNSTQKDVITPPDYIAKAPTYITKAPQK